MEFIRCDVVDGRLKLSTSEAINPRAGLEVKIRVPSLTSFAAAGKVNAQLILAPGGGSLRAAGLTHLSARHGWLGRHQGCGRKPHYARRPSWRVSVDSEGASRIAARKLSVPKVSVSAVGASRVNLGPTDSLQVTGQVLQPSNMERVSNSPPRRPVRCACVKAHLISRSLSSTKRCGVGYGPVTLQHGHCYLLCWSRHRPSWPLFRTRCLELSWPLSGWPV